MEKRIAIASVVVLLSIGCTAIKKREAKEPAKTENATVKKFEEGLVYLEKENYTQAEKVFTGLLLQKPTTEFDIMVQYNLAASYEGQKNCQKAAEAYRTVARSPIKKINRMQAQALFRLSYAYECLGDHKKNLVALLDVNKRKQYLPIEVGQAEVPARIAAAYARIGQLKTAQKYFAEAEKGIQLTRQQYKDSAKENEILARVLYFMGRLDYAQPQNRTVEGQIRSLRLLQTYLLRSIALNSRPWSDKSKEHLISIYESSLKTVQDELKAMKPEDKNRKQMVKTQTSRLNDLLENIEDLKKLRVPDIEEPDMLKSLFSKVDSWDRNARSELEKLPEQNELTADGRQRQAIKRPGKVVSPTTSLEKKE